MCRFYIDEDFGTSTARLRDISSEDRRRRLICRYGGGRRDNEILCVRRAEMVAELW